MTESFSFSVVLEPQEDGGFTVLVPALPEVVTEGDTEEEALANAHEAIRAISRLPARSRHCNSSRCPAGNSSRNRGRVSSSPFSTGRTTAPQFCSA